YESRSIAGWLERKTNRGVDAWLPGRRMRSAKTPRLDDPLARHKLDLPALNPATEDREGIAFASCDLGRHSRRSAEQAATGEQVVHLPRRRGDERFLMDEHLGWRHRSPFCFAASSVRGAPERTSAANLEVIAQALHVVVPAASAHVDALQLLAQSLVVEVE